MLCMPSSALAAPFTALEHKRFVSCIVYVDLPSWRAIIIRWLRPKTAFIFCCRIRLLSDVYDMVYIILAIQIHAMYVWCERTNECDAVVQA